MYACQLFAHIFPDSYTVDRPLLQEGVPSLPRLNWPVASAMLSWCLRVRLGALGLSHSCSNHPSPGKKIHGNQGCFLLIISSTSTTMAPKMWFIPIIIAVACIKEKKTEGHANSQRVNQ